MQEELNGELEIVPFKESQKKREKHLGRQWKKQQRNFLNSFSS